MKELHFEVKLTAKDLWQFTMYHAYQGMSGIFAAIFTIAAVILILVRWSVLVDFQKILLVVCLLLFTVWQPGMLYVKARKQAKTPFMQSPMHLTFGEEGLLVQQGEQEISFTWEQIGRVDRKKTMAIVYMDRVHAYLLPDSVMGQEKEAFYDLMKANLPKERTRRL